MSSRQSSGSTSAGGDSSRARRAVTVTAVPPLGCRVTRSARTVSTTGRLGRPGRAGRVKQTSPNTAPCAKRSQRLSPSAKQRLGVAQISQSMPGQWPARTMKS